VENGSVAPSAPEIAVKATSVTLPVPPAEIHAAAEAAVVDPVEDATAAVAAAVLTPRLSFMQEVDPAMAEASAVVAAAAVAATGGDHKSSLPTRPSVALQPLENEILNLRQNEKNNKYSRMLNL